MEFECLLENIEALTKQQQQQRGCKTQLAMGSQNKEE